MGWNEISKDDSLNMSPKNTFHTKKILPRYFKEVWGGKKTFELRLNDCNYRVGDYLLLKEWNEIQYTGRMVLVKISYILENCEEYGLKKGYCILGWQ